MCVSMCVCVCACLSACVDNHQNSTRNCIFLNSISLRRFALRRILSCATFLD